MTRAQPNKSVEDNLTHTLQTEPAWADPLTRRVLHRQSEPSDLPALEPHFSVQVLAEMWRLDESTIRRIFEDAPGVLRLANERRRGKRDYVTLRIPASVAQREYERRLVAAEKRGSR